MVLQQNPINNPTIKDNLNGYKRDTKIIEGSASCALDMTPLLNPGLPT